MDVGRFVIVFRYMRGVYICNILDIDAKGIRHILALCCDMRCADLHAEDTQFWEPIPRANAAGFVYTFVGWVVAEFGKFGA